MCTATLDGEVYRLGVPVQVDGTANLVRTAAQLAKGGGAVLGFDFPIGLPKAYARVADISRFLNLLPELGSGSWCEFFSIARATERRANQTALLSRPSGRHIQEHLVAGLGVRSIDDLLRRCDFGNGDRNKACALFWTLGGNQVGRAALAGWREMLLPGMHALQGELGMWPFEGESHSLLASTAVVIVETYPGDACVQLGLGAPGRGWSTRDRAARIEKGRGLRCCALQMRADVRRLEGIVADGFGASNTGEDQFDAVVGLLGMLAVILGLRVDGTPKDEAVNSVECWIFGQRSAVGPWVS
jgi:hypothetical protein